MKGPHLPVFELVFVNGQKALLGVVEFYEPKCKKVDLIKSAQEVTMRHLVTSNVPPNRGMLLVEVHVCRGP